MADEKKAEQKTKATANPASVYAQKIKARGVERLEAARKSAENPPEGFALVGAGAAVEESPFADIGCNVVDFLAQPELREQVITAANARVNIPYVPEGMEAQIFGWAFDLTITALNDLFNCEAQ
jgi:2-keto-3-deoxy-6-phosphogluconate aldolase